MEGMVPPLLYNGLGGGVYEVSGTILHRGCSVDAVICIRDLGGDLLCVADPGGFPTPGGNENNG